MDVQTPIPPSRRLLTDDQMQRAVALFAYLLDLRESGHRLALVHLDDALGVRSVERRVDIAPNQK